MLSFNIYIYLDPKLHWCTAEHSKGGSHGPCGKLIIWIFSCYTFLGFWGESGAILVRQTGSKIGPPSFRLK